MKKQARGINEHTRAGIWYGSDQLATKLYTVHTHEQRYDMGVINSRLDRCFNVFYVHPPLNPVCFLTEIARKTHFLFHLKGDFWNLTIFFFSKEPTVTMSTLPLVQFFPPWRVRESWLVVQRLDRQKREAEGRGIQPQYEVIPSDTLWDSRNFLFFWFF